MSGSSKLSPTLGNITYVTGKLINRLIVVMGIRQNRSLSKVKDYCLYD